MCESVCVCVCECVCVCVCVCVYSRDAGHAQLEECQAIARDYLQRIGAVEEKTKPAAAHVRRGVLMALGSLPRHVLRE